MIAADGIHSELRPYVFPPSQPVFHGSVAYRGLVAHEQHSALADRALADVARHGKALPRLSGARRHDDQLCRLRPGGRGNEGVMVGARRSGRSARASSPAGTRGSRRCWQRCETTFRWALYDREPLPTWTKGRLAPARRCRASDAAASRTGREPVDRGRHGAGNDPGARRPQYRARRPHRLRAAAPRARRAGPARGARRTACATTPPIRISACATPRSRRTRRSAGSSTITTWCRTRRMRARPSWANGQRPADPPFSGLFDPIGCALPRGRRDGHAARHCFGGTTTIT